MSVNKWAYDPEKCEGRFCCGDCDYCDCDYCDSEALDKDVTDYLMEHMDEDDLEAQEIEIV